MSLICGIRYVDVNMGVFLAQRQFKYMYNIGVQMSSTFFNKYMPIGLIVAAFLLVGSAVYTDEFPNEPLSSAPKNIEVGLWDSSVQVEELDGLTRFRASKGSIYFAFQKTPDSPIQFLSFGCTHAYKSLPHYWRALRHTRVRVLPGTRTIVSIDNLDQNIKYNFSQESCKK